MIYAREYAGKFRASVGVFLPALFGLLSLCDQVSAQSQPVPQIRAVVNAGSFLPDGPLAPGVIFSLFGSALTDGSTASSTTSPLTSQLSGTIVLVNGVPAPLFFVSPLQINAQFPVEVGAVSSARVSVQVRTSAGSVVSSNEFVVAVRPSAPAIFTWNQNGGGPGAILRSSDFTRICPPGRSDCTANVAAPGEVVSIYATGLGRVAGNWRSGVPAEGTQPTEASAEVSIGGFNAEVLYAGLAPGFVGLYQLNVRIPAAVPREVNVPVIATIAGGYSNTATIATGGSSTTATPLPAGGGPYGGSILSLAMDPTNSATIYAGTGGTGVFKSTDAGLSWRQVGLGLPGDAVRDISVDPTSPTTLYAAAGFAGAYKSIDGGATWSAINNGLRRPPGDTRIQPFIYSIEIDPSKPNLLYAGTDSGLRKSSNWGRTWEVPESLVAANVPRVIVHPTDSSLFAVYNNFSTGSLQTFLARSTDGGATWQLVALSLGGSVTRLVIDRANPAVLYIVVGDGTVPSRIFRSANSGATWTQIGTAIDAPVYAMEVDSRGAGTVFLSTHRGVYRSTPGGSWTPINSGLRPGSQDGNQSSLLLDPRNPSVMYVGFGYVGVFKSTNAGDTWVEANRGITNSWVFSVAVDPNRSNVIFASTQSNGLFRSGDSGATWNRVESAILAPTITKLAFDKNSTLYAEKNYGEGLYKSVDSGANWMELPNRLALDPSTGRILVALATDPNAVGVLYVHVYSEGILRSIDGGESWTLLNFDFKGLGVSVISIDAQNSSRIFVSNLDGQIFRSVDAGASWTELRADPLLRVRPMAVVSSERYNVTYAAGEGGFARSAADGQEWNVASSGLTGLPVQALALHASETDTVFAVTGEGGLFRSANRGAVWRKADSDLGTTPRFTFGFNNGLAVDPTNSNTLYIGTALYGVYKSIDGGLTLRPSTQPIR